MASLQVYRRLRWWLVDQPAITGFEWKPGETPFASLPFTAAAVFTYLALTLLIHLRLLPLPRPPAAALRLASAAHNLLLILLSAAMAAGCALASLTRLPSTRHLFCFPRGTPPAGPVFFWAYVFYLSKLYELLDTLFILLSGDGRRRLSFLHVYHHAVVVVMCRVWLATAQSLAPVGLVTNAGVHVVMYGYYLCASLGWRWPASWKRAVTEVQIAQFVFGFAVSGVFLWYHFAGGGCEGMKGWVFNAVFNASLLLLFLDFHSGAYKAAGAAGKRRELEKEKGQ